ncbi:CPBP family intramembrane glutamic endopeptidase [Geodermatophilus normandii]|uniref:CPBP family intramembrane metalloprotease n=1 Tax=Geodermatophilus normandii TaxID=1137989 RepID=A0A6P0GI20_9ACTN|nr:CPBP family intramembrane glutamic endopeptidase [Geodermatophilus normandii]NEM06904.1 CPBP family intramembrane metalloprotease [Geodermatophilus normandii]
MTRAVPTRSATVRRHGAFVVVLVAILAVWNNIVVPQVPDSTASYVGVNGAASAVLVVAARWTGLTWAELGLGRRRLWAGLQWGGACFAAVALAFTVAVTVPALRPLLTDARTADLTAGDVAAEVLVRIPLGTVLWEEVAFRGVLLAALARVLPLRRAVAAAAIVFGVWHVRPTLSGLEANDLVDAAWLRTLAVLGVCTFTAAAGALLCWLRLRSGSLLAPALLHLATNTLGTVAATAAHRLG